MPQFMQLPSIEFPQNAVLDVRGFGNALGEFGTAMKERGERQQNALIGGKLAAGDYAGGASEAFRLGKLDTGLGIQKFKTAQDTAAEERQTKLIQRMAGLAEDARNEKDPARQADKFKKFMAIPGVMNALPEAYRADPHAALGYIVSSAYPKDPLERRKTESDIAASGATAYAQRQHGDYYKAQAAALATKAGYEVKEVGGKLVAYDKAAPAKATVIYGGGDANVAENISGGLTELAGIPQRYDAFEHGVGTFRGSESHHPMGYLARTWGSVSSLVQGTRDSPSEVRRAIDGSVQTLAASIKPLIRKPGEGTWGIIDQEKLESVVGNLKLANNKAEYYRGLEEVRRRLKANFNVDLPPIPGVTPETKSGLPAAVPASVPPVVRAAPPAQPAVQPVPAVGTYRDTPQGRFRFRGGNPNDRTNWEGPITGR